MEESKSPVLSCKKKGKSTKILLASPILSCGRKRKKPLPDDSPVFLRSIRKTRSSKGGESPVIDSFCSPPTSEGSPMRPHKLKPKSLFIDIDETPPSVNSQLSQTSAEHSRESNHHIIEEESHSESSGSESEVIVHERTMSDNEDKLDTTVTDASSRSQNSTAISQTSSYYSGISTPEKKTVRSKPIPTGSARKKRQYKPSGLAKQLSKLLVRQESDYHLWKFQQKLSSSSTTETTLRDDSFSARLKLRIESLWVGKIHRFAHCCNLLQEQSRVEGSLSYNRVSLLFTPERWERFNSVQAGDIVSIYEPWQSVELMGGVTLLLDFNLLLLCKKVTKEEEVSKLSNIVVGDGLLGSSSTSVHDFTDAADGRACSSASADNIAVAENRRPSSVTVLQTWTCPCQGCTLCHTTI
ncbi:uncharacterized protein LOC116926520 isoform X1 [Daphnia magna]|uniref:uncharacterized protein LOC116926520 isoform X1 n=1 Tax=Daphnia magna TaxID=35525 RepID=UPI001E1BAC85|nr:uncharacterized protein LOC116926520 isoform X1 [Daphnia magna]